MRHPTRVVDPDGIAFSYKDVSQIYNIPIGSIRVRASLWRREHGDADVPLAAVLRQSKDLITIKVHSDKHTPKTWDMTIPELVEHVGKPRTTVMRALDQWRALYSEGPVNLPGFRQFAVQSKRVRDAQLRRLDAARRRVLREVRGLEVAHSERLLGDPLEPTPDTNNEGGNNPE